MQAALLGELWPQLTSEAQGSGRQTAGTESSTPTTSQPFNKFVPQFSLCAVGC